MLRPRDFFRILTVLIFFTLLVSGCTGKTATNLPEPSYSAPITENVLLAINAGDYSAFSRDFDSTMIKAIPPGNFTTQFTNNIQAKSEITLRVQNGFFNLQVKPNAQP
jgi:hypothetical protein